MLARAPLLLKTGSPSARVTCARHSAFSHAKAAHTCRISNQDQHATAVSVIPLHFDHLFTSFLHASCAVVPTNGLAQGHHPRVAFGIWSNGREKLQIPQQTSAYARSLCTCTEPTPFRGRHLFSFCPFQRRRCFSPRCFGSASSYSADVSRASAIPLTCVQLPGCSLPACTAQKRPPQRSAKAFPEVKAYLPYFTCDTTISISESGKVTHG